MISAQRAPATDSWTEAGRRSAEAIGAFHAAAIVSEDPGAAARVARGIGAALARERRVILADMIGSVPALRELTADPDPEGVAESFAYGVALGKLARETPVANLFVVHSGSEPVDRDEIFRSGRWGRLASQCRASGALLLVVAHSSATGLAELVRQLDGAVLVGMPDAPAGFRVLHRTDAAVPAGPARRRKRWPVAAALLLVLLAGGGSVLLWRAGAFPPRTADREPQPAVTVATTAEMPSLAQSRALVANPADSARAASFAVEMITANTLDGANFELARQRNLLPAATLAPVHIGEEQSVWYKVIVGAFMRHAQADSLLRATRGRGDLDLAAGMVIEAPFALLVDSIPPRGELHGMVERYVRLGVPAYALVQDDGSARVYAGAFTRAADAATLATELREHGMQPVLVYRTGRAF